MTSTTSDTITAAGFIGNVTGNISGIHIGGQQDSIVAAAADGAISIAPKTVMITKAGVCALTLAAPTATTHDGYIIRIVATTAHAHTVTAATIGFNAANAGGDVATFGGAIGDNLTIIAYQGEWYILNAVNVTLA